MVIKESPSLMYCSTLRFPLSLARGVSVPGYSLQILQLDPDPMIEWIWANIEWMLNLNGLNWTNVGKELNGWELNGWELNWLDTKIKLNSNKNEHQLKMNTEIEFNEDRLNWLDTEIELNIRIKLNKENLNWMDIEVNFNNYEIH